VLDKYTIIENDRIRTVYNWLQYFEKETLQHECESNVLVIEEMYRDVAGRPFSFEANEKAVVLRVT
jgi:hypothetical protein